MINRAEAMRNAREFSVSRNLGWSESGTAVKRKNIKTEPCWAIHTADRELSTLHWTEGRMVTYFIVYISMVTGKCIAWQFLNRGLNIVVQHQIVHTDLT